MATHKNTDNRSKKGEKRNVQSKFEEMSVDDILGELTSGKANTTEEIKVANSNGRPARKLAPVSSQAKPQVTSSENKKKKIVISAELPDYEAIRRAEQEKAVEEVRADSLPSQEFAPKDAENSDYKEDIQNDIDEYSEEEYSEDYQSEDEYESDEDDTDSKYDIEDDEDEESDETDETDEDKEKPKKKGFFAKLKELLYKNVDDDDDEEDEEETDGDEESDSFDDAEFSVEPIEDNSDEIISDAMKTINSDSLSDDSDYEDDYIETAEDIDSSDYADNYADDFDEEIESDLDNDINNNADYEPDDVEEYDDEDGYGEDDSEEEYDDGVNDIFDENPDDILEIRDNSTVEGAVQAVPKKKRNVYAVIGVIFAVLALCGLVAIAVKGVSQVKSFTSGDTKKEAFTKVIYPAVIMDIQPFSSTAELTSEQLVTASLWSIIMDESKISKYQNNMGAVYVPASDVEVEAKQMFGENIVPITHCTVGPADARFYYDADTNVYTVQANTIVYTYQPDVKSATKNANEYSVIVDYLQERPAWMDKASSKTVEYKLTEREDGTYFITGMRIISVNTSND